MVIEAKNLWAMMAVGAVEAMEPMEAMEEVAVVVMTRDDFPVEVANSEAWKCCNAILANMTFF